MKESEKILYTKAFVDAISRGTNPLTGEVIPDGDLMRNDRMVKCMSYISEILEASAERQSKLEAKKEEREKYVSFPTLVKALRLRYPEQAFFLGKSAIFYWMLKKGYGEYIRDEAGYRRKIASKSGNEIGIFNKQTKRREMLFDKNAQEIIFRNVDEITQMSRDRYEKRMRGKAEE